MMQGVCSLSLYVGIAPFLALQAICTWTLLYWIYKVTLLRIAKRPKPEMTGVVNQVSGCVPLCHKLNVTQLTAIKSSHVHSVTMRKMNA